MNQIRMSEEAFISSGYENEFIDEIETVFVNVLIGDGEKGAYNYYDALMILPHNIYVYGEELNKKIREALNKKTSVYILDNRGNVNKLICPQKPTIM